MHGLRRDYQLVWQEPYMPTQASSRRKSHHKLVLQTSCVDSRTFEGRYKEFSENQSASGLHRFRTHTTSHERYLDSYYFHNETFFKAIELPRASATVASQFSSQYRRFRIRI